MRPHRNSRQEPAAVVGVDLREGAGRIRRVWSSRAFGLVLALVLCATIASCKRPYRVGEYVLVTWEEDKPPYPAYIIDKKSRTRYRVHFDGYESRWDEEVSLDRIVGRVKDPVTPPPPPSKVARASGISPQASSSARAALYKVGDRVRVRWRGSVYQASIVGVVAPDRFLVHYDGHESAWDEVVHIDRIVARR